MKLSPLVIGLQGSSYWYQDKDSNIEHCRVILADPFYAGIWLQGLQIRLETGDEAAPIDFALFTVTNLQHILIDMYPLLALSNAYGCTLVGHAQADFSDCNNRLSTNFNADPGNNYVIGRIDTEVVKPKYQIDEATFLGKLADTEQQAKAEGELIEILDDPDQTQKLVVIAPHGGMIENYTDEQAEQVRAWINGMDQSTGSQTPVTLWRCKGWKPSGGAFNRWHITSTELNPASFPQLNIIYTRGFEYGVAFHGCDDNSGTNPVYIGGNADPTLRANIASNIEAKINDKVMTDQSFQALLLSDNPSGTLTTEIISPSKKIKIEINVKVINGIYLPKVTPTYPLPSVIPEDYRGVDPANLINRLVKPANGQQSIHLEQSIDVRKYFYKEIAEAVAEEIYNKIQSAP